MPSRRVKRNKPYKKSRFKTKKKLSDNSPRNRSGGSDPTLFTDVPYKWGETRVKDKHGRNRNWEQAYLESRRPLQRGDNSKLTSYHPTHEFDNLVPERRFMPDGTTRVAMIKHKTTREMARVGRKISDIPSRFKKTINNNKK